MKRTDNIPVDPDYNLLLRSLAEVDRHNLAEEDILRHSWREGTQHVTVSTLHDGHGRHEDEDEDEDDRYESSTIVPSHHDPVVRGSCGLKRKKPRPWHCT